MAVKSTRREVWNRNQKASNLFQPQCKNWSHSRTILQKKAVKIQVRSCNTLGWLTYLFLPEYSNVYLALLINMDFQLQVQNLHIWKPLVPTYCLVIFHETRMWAWKDTRNEFSYFIAQPPYWLYSRLLWIHLFKSICSLIIVQGSP